MYGDHEYEMRIEESVRESLVGAVTEEAVMQWEDFLGSEDIPEKAEITLLSNNSHKIHNFHVDCLSNPSGCKSFINLRGENHLVTHYGLIENSRIGELKRTHQPDFAWENTGHGPTKNQRRVIETIALEIPFVTRTYTEWQNPDHPEASSLNNTPKYDAIRYSISDNNNVIRGKFQTHASSAEEQQFILSHIRPLFEKLCKDMGL